MKVSEKSYDEVKALFPDINLLIITANEIETFHVRQALLPLEKIGEVIKVPHGQHTYFVGTFGEYHAVHVQLGKMGSISDAGAILTASDSIATWNPKAIVMIGVAMGVDEDKQHIGDVLVSETIISYESQRLGSKKIVSRGPIVESGTVLLNRFKNVSGWYCTIEDGNVSKMLPGQILSGEKLIDNLRERNKILKTYPQAIGAEMEGAGIYAACKNKGVSEWILVKGICDYGDGNKGVDKEKRQNLAAQSATSLSLAVFGSKIGFTGMGLVPIVREDIKNGANDVISTEIKEEIVAIVEVKSNNSNKNMHSAVQLTVAAFLELSSYQKAIVIEEVGFSLSGLSNLSGHEMDMEFFRYVKEQNLLSKLWTAISKIKPFSNNQNPFV